MTDFCAPQQDHGLLSIQAAQNKIDALLTPIDGSEKLTLKLALRRVLAENIHAPINLPIERNAAMDGYAFDHRDVNVENSFSLLLAGTSWAGHPYSKNLQRGQCVRIFTGAVLPDGADSVVMQELVSVDGERISFPAGTKALQNVRQAGEDLRKGQLMLAAPKRLSAIDLALLAAAGITSVTVYRRLKIAYFSTGDELYPPGQTLKSGKIYDSNRYLLHGLLADEPYDTTDLGIVADEKDLLRDRLRDAAQHHDVIVSTGGASVGEADYIHELLAETGRVEFWKIAMKPGKPLAFGKIGNCWFFGLPGNPIAVMATYHQFVAPALRKLSGVAAPPPLRFKALCTSALKKSPGRQDFQRGVFRTLDQGGFTVASAGGQGSHLLASASAANCYIILPEDNCGVQPGEEVEIEPFVSFAQ